LFFIKQIYKPEG